MSYCAKSDIESVFGVSNVDNWADLDNDADASKIAARIARAIVVAESEVNDIFRRTGYLIPIVDADGNTPNTIENLTATMAGLWLYEARGISDQDRDGRPVHRLRYMRLWVRNMLKEIANGNRKIDALQ